MTSVYFEVDKFDTVNACMLECMKIKKKLNEQNVKAEIRTQRDKYNHIKHYELLFKDDFGYTVYQMIKD